MSTKRVHSEMAESKEGKTGRKITVAATQMDCSSENEEVNHAKAEHWVRAAAQAGADVVLLQELFSGPYFCIDMLAKHFALAKPAKGHPLLTRMSILAKELNIVIPVSFFEASGNVFYNSLCMIDSDGSQLGIYRKSHIPDGNGYSEKFYFTPGDTGFKVWDTKKCRIGVAICWDQWFPEAARAMSLEGAEILLYPTAIGSEPHDASIDSHEHWRRTMQGHAAANYRPVIASNRVGKELSLANKEWSITFYGTSFIADETGGIVKDMDKTSEGVITHTFDLDEIAANRSAWGLFRDRRPDLYSSLCSHGGEWGGSSYYPQSTANCPRTPFLAASNVNASSTAAQLEPTDYRMPAEWEPHSACWIGFPQREDNWPQHAGPAQENFIAVVKAISQFEPVNVCVPSNLWTHVSQVFKDFPTVRVIELAQNDSWFRDSAPTFVVPRSVGKPNISPLVGVCWSFNGYGEMYECDIDKLISSKICAMEKVPTFHPGVVLEGGSIHVDGLGTLVTTEQCLLGPNALGKFRNPGVTKIEMEELFKRYLGVTKVLWIPKGVLTDLDTTGHVDNMCCFLRPGVLALHWVDRSEDPAQNAISQDAFDYLSAQTDALGRPFEIVKVLPPRNLLRREDEVCKNPIGNKEGEDVYGRQAGDPLPGSYINFFMPNGAAIVPQFGDAERDAFALAVYQKHLPARKVIGLPARQVLVGGGCIHCILMQQPVGNRG